MGRGFVAIVVGPAAAVALSGCGGGSSVPLPCKPQPSGALCIKVFQDGATVRDVIGYLAASESPLSGRTWQLALESYPCDPGTGSVPKCVPTAIYRGATRHGNPPVAVFCRTAGGTTVTAPTGCHDTLAQALASFGDFRGFHLPKRFPSRVWLCVEEKLVRGPPPPPAPPARACAEISP